MNELQLALTSLAIVAFSALVVVQRVDGQARRDADRVVVRLHFSAGLTVDQIVSFVRALSAAGSGSVVFEVVATATSVEHYLRLPRTKADFILAQLRAAVAAVGVEEVVRSSGPVSRARELRLVGDNRSLRTDTAAETASAILAALRPSVPGQTATLQLVASPAEYSAPATPARIARPRLVLGRRLPLEFLPGQVVKLSAKDERDKAVEPSFRTVVRVGTTTGGAVGIALLRRVTAVLRVVERPGLHFASRLLPRFVVTRRVERASSPVFEVPARLNAAEIATLIAWPVAGSSISGLRLTASRRLDASGEVPRRGRVFGDSAGWGERRPVATSIVDTLHHAHVIGPTGVGKSTLLANIAVQDMAAGRSLVVVDPKGDLVADLLDRVPRDRQHDVIVLDPADDRPVGLNPFAGAHRSPELVTDAVLAMMRKRWSQFWGPRLQDVLSAALLTLARRPDSTLCELPLLLTDDAFRARLVAEVDDRFLAGFWASYDAWSPAERAQALGPVLNKVRDFIVRPKLRHLFGQAEPTWSMDDVLNRQKILLVNLAKGELGSETAALIGSTVVAMLWRSIQTRAIRLPASVILDEFQDVVALPTDLGDVLAQARSFGVGLSLAHQHLHQLPDPIRHAVAANCRTKVVFQSGIDDATALAKQLGGELAAHDITNLPTHEAYLAPCVDRRTSTPVSIATRPLPAGNWSAELVRAASRERYGRDRAEIEAAIEARQVGPAVSESVGRKRRQS